MTSDTLDLGPAPRVLFLAADAGRVRAQLAGERLTRAQAGALRDDISTDEITPVRIMAHYDARLARFPYTGFTTANGERPIAPGAVQAGGFVVTVGGRRYGKGSSREHSPAAEKAAGIRLVIAESFERIYRQNADNIGLFTSTDFGLLDRIARGEPTPLAELVADRDALTAGILRAGGLLRFGQAHLRDAVAVGFDHEAAAGPPRTLFEKILRRHLVRTAVTPTEPRPGEGCFVRADWRFIHEYYTGMAAHMLEGLVADAPLHDAASIRVFEDHTAYLDESPAHAGEGLRPLMREMIGAQRDFARRHGLRLHRTRTEAEGPDPTRDAAGISHAMMAEHYALPGQVVVGTDSHTPHSGALGCVAFGVGTTDMANAFVTGVVRVTLPPVLRVDLQGRLPDGVSAKDIVLHLLALPTIRAGGGVGRVFEFTGDGTHALSIDERTTLTNMTAELGGFTGIVAPDEETVRFLRERRGVAFELQQWMRSDEGAAYEATLTVDCTRLSPYVAAPGDPGHGQPIASVAERPRIDIAYGGSCTAGKREDFEQYHAVLAWGLANGLRVPQGVQLFLQYGTTAVRDWCVAQGWDATFQAAGARMLQPACGACANCGPGSSVESGQVTVSAINRNFPGRSGPGQVWLASPATVAASALAGRLVSFEELRGEAGGRGAGRAGG